VLDKVFVEPSLLSAKAGDQFQFMRKGYYTVDSDSTDEKLVFNQTVSLKDSWGKKQKKK
jgi:glutaminyl-tRNA synthetase